MIQVRDGKPKRDAASLELEINTLRRIVERRHSWLADPINRMRGTYEAVLRDTHNIEYQLMELEQEYEALLTTKNS